MDVTTHHDYYFVVFFLLFNLLWIMCTTKSRRKNQIQDTEQRIFLCVHRDVLGMGTDRFNVWFYVYYRREWLLKWIIMVHAVTPTSKINLVLWFRAWKQYKKTYQLRLYCYLKICIPSPATIISNEISDFASLKL